VASLGVGVPAAHAAGVLHRDVNRENVLISAYRERQLADFGVARIQGEAPSRSGMITGSLADVASEVLSGQLASAASDVYSVASTLYQLLAGRPAFVRDGEESLHPLIARILGRSRPISGARGSPKPCGRH
jgi:serine/threonine protein kinase